MRAKESLFDGHEHEYAVAGWLGTIAVMESMGGVVLSHKCMLSGHSKHLYQTCKVITKRQEPLTDRIRKWLEQKAKNEDRVGALNRAGILTNNRFDPDFREAYEMFDNPLWRDYVEVETDFGRLADLIYEASSYFSEDPESLLLQADLADTIQNVRRDIDFHVGMYDPVRK